MRTPTLMYKSRSSYLDDGLYTQMLVEITIALEPIPVLLKMPIMRKRKVEEQQTSGSLARVYTSVKGSCRLQISHNTIAKE